MKTTRKAALDSGEKFYLTGKPCSYGHITKRIASNGRCYECSKSHASFWKAENRDHCSSYLRDWYIKNPSRKKVKNANNRQQVIERRSKQRNATPKWFEKDLVASVYKKAVDLGFEVDHIVPINGKTVCGLHCWHNLQLLEPKINNQKGNRFWPDMF